MSLDKETITTIVENYDAFYGHVFETFGWYIDNLPKDVTKYLESIDQDFQNARYDYENGCIDNISIEGENMELTIGCSVMGEYCSDYILLPLSIIIDRDNLSDVITKLRYEKHKDEEMVAVEKAKRAADDIANRRRLYKKLKKEFEND